MNQTLSVYSNCSVHLPKPVAVSYFLLSPVESIPVIAATGISEKSVFLKAVKRGTTNAFLLFSTCSVTFPLTV